MVTWLDIILISIVEGITEFLPISSTGHMIITQRLLNISESPQLAAFEVIVQTGAILAVVSVFWKTFLTWFKAWLNLFTKNNAAENTSNNYNARKQSLYVIAAVIPFGILGLILHKYIKALFSIPVVASALITGAFLILISEYVFKKSKTAHKSLDNLNLKDALALGCGQCLALWPGFSRSAATIIAGRFAGYSQESAAELSFLIGLPTLLGAAGFEMIKEFKNIDALWSQYLAVGIVIAWAVAFLFVKAFIIFLRKYSLRAFAIYRIILGIALLVWFY